MANPAITRIDFSTGAAVLYTADPKIRYTFPIAGKDAFTLPAPVVVDNTKNIADLAASLKALGDKFDGLVIKIGAGGAAPSAPPAPAPPSTTAPQGWTELTLSPADNIRAACAVAGKGFKLKLTPGSYKQCIVVPRGLDGWEIASSTGSAADVQIDGQGGLTVAQNNSGSGPTRLAYGKGVILGASPGTVRDIEITGGGTNATDGHDGQAGMYWDVGDAQGGECKLVRCMIRKNQNGIFGNTQNTNVHYIADHCDFVDNSVDGGSHDTYLNGGGTTKATFIECQTNGSKAGNNFKTRVPFVELIGGFNGTQNANRWVELAEGGVLTVQGGVYVGNDIGQNVFGNGTESTSKGPGDTTWAGGDIYLGNRTQDFANAGKFTATGVAVHANPGGQSQVINSKGGALNGLTITDTKAAPSFPAFVSGAR